MRRIIGILLISLTPLCMFAQYIVVDKDGYTNVRKEQNTKSEILGRATRLDLLSNANDDCELDEKDRFGKDIQETDSWMPILIRGNNNENV